MNAEAGKTELQLSGLSPTGEWLLSVVARRTYVLTPDGDCVLAKRQLPLVDDPVYPEHDGSLLLADVDVWPFKPRTDVVVLGHAYNHPGRAVFDASVKVGAVEKVVRVLGDRGVTLTAAGRIAFSAPTKLDKVPLSYAHAYGGKDAVSEEAHGNPAEDFAPFLPPESGMRELVAAASPFVYPRNPSGRGFVTSKSKAALEAVRLPNLEAPDDPLTPDRLVPESPWHWPEQPLPASFGWMDYGCFPRIAWFGVVPGCEVPSDLSRVGEIRLGHVRRDVFVERTMEEHAVDLEATCGASLGLRLPYLDRSEAFELRHLTSSSPTFRFRLPGEKPRIFVDGRDGKLDRTDPVIHTVVIEPDVGRLTVVWRGAARALRPYMPEELPRMPFRVEW